MKPYRDYKEFLLKELQDPNRALGYLRETLKDKDKRVFLLALKDVAEAYGGFTELSQKSKLSREHLYDLLSKKGNPELKTLQALLDALGFRLSIELKKPKKAA